MPVPGSNLATMLSSGALIQMALPSATTAGHSGLPTSNDVLRLVRESIRWIEFFGEFATHTEPYLATCQSGARGPPTSISAITLGRSDPIGCRTAESGFAGVVVGETICAEVATLFGC